MWWLFVLVAKTQAFGPVSVQWAGGTARNYVLAPRSLTSRAAVAAQSLIVMRRPSSTSPIAVPQFTFNTDKTITLGSMGWCIDAAVRVGRNRDEVMINRCNGKPTQKFNWVDHGVEHKSQIQVVGTTKCLTIRDLTHEDNLPDGASIVLRECDGKSASWQFEETNLLPSDGLPQHSMYSSTLWHALISCAALITFGFWSLSRWLRLWQPRLLQMSREGGIPLNMETAGVSLMAISAMLQGGRPLIAQVDMKEQDMFPAVMVHSPVPLEDPRGLSIEVTVPEGIHSGQEFNFVVADGREFTLTAPDGVEPGQSVTVKVPATPVPSVPASDGPMVNAPVQEALPPPQFAPTSTIEVSGNTCSSDPCATRQLAFEEQLKFQEQLASARIQQSNILASISQQPTILNFEHILDYDRFRFPLRDTLLQLLGLADFESLHESLPGFSHKAEAHSRVIREKARLLQPFADNRRAASFLAAYDAMICEVVAPHVAAVLPCDRVHYAALPTLRVQHPSEFGTIRPHVDGMYGLQEGSINYWLPLTSPLHTSATLHVESTPGSGVFHPLLPLAGQMVGFNGWSSMHYTRPNQSGSTRVSLDFRVVPGILFDESTRLARHGYFSTAHRETSCGAFVKENMGRISKLHGLPHSAEPTRDPE